MADNDDFDLDNDDQDQNPQDSPVIADFRKRERSKDRKIKEMEKELDELKAFKEETVRVALTSRAQESLKAAGLPEQMAGLYLKVNPDVQAEGITTEGMKAFAAEYGLAPAPAQKVEAQQLSEETHPTFEPTVGGKPTQWEPVATNKLIEAAKRGDNRALDEAVAREIESPGSIKFKYPELLGE